MTNNAQIANSIIISKIFVSASVLYLLATLIGLYFVYLWSVVDICSSESNSDSDCDWESTDSEWTDISDLRRDQVGVDNDDDIDSGTESVS